MDMPAEELTDAEIENLFAKGVVKGDTKRFEFGDAGTLTGAEFDPPV